MKSSADRAGENGENGIGPEESDASMAARAAGFLCGLGMLGFSTWWGYRLIEQPTSSATIALLPAVLAGVVAMAFLAGGRVIVVAALLIVAPVFLYLLAGEGPPKWAAYAYLGAWLAALTFLASNRPS